MFEEWFVREESGRIEDCSMLEVVSKKLILNKKTKNNTSVYYFYDFLKSSCEMSENF